LFFKEEGHVIHLSLKNKKEKEREKINPDTLMRFWVTCEVCGPSNTWPLFFICFCFFFRILIKTLLFSFFMYFLVYINFLFKF
jgi:hypothetical protein